jgi:hypothetical protein
LVGIVQLRTKATEFSCFFLTYNSRNQWYVFKVEDIYLYNKVDGTYLLHAFEMWAWFTTLMTKSVVK